MPVAICNHHVNLEGARGCTFVKRVNISQKREHLLRVCTFVKTVNICQRVCTFFDSNIFHQKTYLMNI